MISNIGAQEHKGIPDSVKKTLYTLCSHRAESYIVLEAPRLSSDSCKWLIAK